MGDFGLLKISENQEESESTGNNDTFRHNTDCDNAPAHIQAVHRIRDILGMPILKSDTDDSENALFLILENTGIPRSWVCRSQRVG
jgi:hypothetical protein